MRTAVHTVGALTDAVRERRAELGTQFGRRLRDTVPEYHAVDAGDFQQAGWSALFVVIDGALDAVDDPVSGQDLPPELLAESRAAARHALTWTVLGRTYQLTHRAVCEALMTEGRPTSTPGGSRAPSAIPPRCTWSPRS